MVRVLLGGMNSCATFVVESMSRSLIGLDLVVIDFEFVGGRLNVVIVGVCLIAPRGSFCSCRIFTNTHTQTSLRQQNLRPCFRKFVPNSHSWSIYKKRCLFVI